MSDGHDRAINDEQLSHLSGKIFTISGSVLKCGEATSGDIVPIVAKRNGTTASKARARWTCEATSICGKLPGQNFVLELSMPWLH